MKDKKVNLASTLNTGKEYFKIEKSDTKSDSKGNDRCED